MEASALQAPGGVARSRISIGAPLLRLRSDEQLVALFRSGNDDAFRLIHDRYRQRLFAYTRQMLPGSRQDAEDALQDVFVRAYSGLRANDRDVALRAWLYRVAHNRCIDELRRPPAPTPELIELVRAPTHDPIAEAEERESLRRLIADVRRLPDQQRSALLMRELSGMSYSELAAALAISVPAVKSLLVRARVGLAQAMEARETACSTIRDELIGAHDRRVRPNANARRHLRDCAGCREFRTEIRGVSRQLAALTPALGPLGVLANLLGIGGGAGGGAAAGSGAAAAGSGAAAGGGVAVATGVVGSGGAFAAGGMLATGAGHVATILAAAVVTAGGAVEVQHSIATPVKHHVRHHVRVKGSPVATNAVVVSATLVVTDQQSTVTSPAAVAASPPAGAAPATPAPSSPQKPAAHAPTTAAKPTLNSTATGPSTGGSAPNDPNAPADRDPAGGAATGTGTGSAAVSTLANSTNPAGTTPTTSQTPTSGGGATPSSTATAGTSSPGTSSSTGSSSTSTTTGSSTPAGSATGTGSTGAGSSSGPNGADSTGSVGSIH